MEQLNLELLRFRNNLLYYTKHQSKWFNNLASPIKIVLNTFFPQRTQKYSDCCLDLDISKLKEYIPNLRNCSLYFPVAVLPDQISFGVVARRLIWTTKVQKSMKKFCSLPMASTLKT